MKISIKQCQCSYPKCKTYWLTGIGSFYQGAGFTKFEAKLIARLLNRHRKRKVRK